MRKINLNLIKINRKDSFKKNIVSGSQEKAQEETSHINSLVLEFKIRKV